MGKVKSKNYKLWVIKPFPESVKKRPYSERVKHWKKSLRKMHYKSDGMVFAL